MVPSWRTLPHSELLHPHAPPPGLALVCCPLQQLSLAGTRVTTTATCAALHCMHSRHRLEELQSELQRVRAEESDALAALRKQEEALLALASQLKEAAHTEISTLQATEGRLLSVVQHSTQRLRSMQVQRQQQREQVAELLHNPQQLVQLVLSGGYIMFAGGAVATAAAVFAATQASFSIAAGGGGGLGGSGGSSGFGGSSGSAGGPPGTGGAGAPACGPVATAAAARAGGMVTSLSRERQSDGDDSDSGSSSRWRSRMATSNLDDLGGALPSVSELPRQLSALLSSDSDSGMSSHLHVKAAQAAAATQVLHALQQQEAQAAVKSAELAASSLEVEKRLAVAVRSEAEAAQQLLSVEQAAREAAGEAEAVLASGRWSSAGSGASVPASGRWAAYTSVRQGDGVVTSTSSSNGSSPSSPDARIRLAEMQEQLSAAARQLAASTSARAAAEGELRALKLTLLQEQQQVRCLQSGLCLHHPPCSSAAHRASLPCSVSALPPKPLQSTTTAKQLHDTQAQLSAVSADLQALQEQLQQQRKRHGHALSSAAQQHEARALQLAEQKLGSQLSEAKAQLGAVLQELEAERASSGRLHESVTRLQAQFADARELHTRCHGLSQSPRVPGTVCPAFAQQPLTPASAPGVHAGSALEAERARAATLSEERSRLEAAWNKATAEAAAAEAAAAVARKQASASAAKASSAAADAASAHKALAEVRETNSELAWKLDAAV